MSADRMFSVSVVSECVSRFGIAALDLRRQLKLPDGVKLYLNKEYRHIFVTESIARKYFPNNVANVRVMIDSSRLKPEHIKVYNDCFLRDSYEVSLSDEEALKLAIEYLEEKRNTDED